MSRHLFKHHKKGILIASGILIVILAVLIFSGVKRSSNIYRVKRENFEALISCKGEIQSEKAELITIPSIFGDRTLEIYDTQIKDLVPEGSILKKGDFLFRIFDTLNSDNTAAMKKNSHLVFLKNSMLNMSSFATDNEKLSNKKEKIRNRISVK